MARPNRAVVFDFGRVLGVAPDEWFSSIEAEFGLSTSIWRPMVAGSTGVETTLGGGPFSSADMAGALAQRLVPLLGERAELAATRMCRVFAEPGVMGPIAPVRALLQTLRRSGFRIGLLTNAPSDSETTMLRELLESGDVDASVISGRDGVGKPAPEAFALILSRLQVVPHQAWFIDDDARHVEAGRLAGLNAVLFDGDAEKLERDLQTAGLEW